MKKVYCVFILAIILTLPGCQSDSPIGSTDVTKCIVPGVPSVEELTCNHYKIYQDYFPPIASAKHTHDGIEQNIETTDPRLICLLDFISYSQETKMTTLRQSYILDDEITELLSSTAPMVEICFLSQSNEADETNGNIEKIVVCGDSYLLFLADSPAWYEGSVLAERYWPYGESVMEKIHENGDESHIEEFLSYDGWGNDYWIDLLEYSGF